MNEEKLKYGLKNDYMFRAAMQSSERMLRGLVSALLDLKPVEIKECLIENPIILGEDIDEKTCILDVKILLNNSKRLNIELQTTNYGDWQDRGLLYLCRAFDDLAKGEKYSELKTTIHIGILDFTLFPDAPEFYSENLLMNTKNHKIFNSKFILRVLDLSYLDKVTEEERDTPLYYWASVFKAQTWKELMILAEKSESIKKAVLKLHELTGEEKIRLQCEARERYWMDWQSSMKASRKEGREEERKNTEYEKKRADKAEEQVKKLRELLEKNGISLKE